MSTPCLRGRRAPAISFPVSQSVSQSVRPPMPLCSLRRPRAPSSLLPPPRLPRSMPVAVASWAAAGCRCVTVASLRRPCLYDAAVSRAAAGDVK